MERKALILPVLLIAGILLVACKPPEPSDSLTFTDQQTEQTNQATSQQFNLNDTQVQLQEGDVQGTTVEQTQRGPMMKTLQDFEPIEGTQVTFTTNKGDVVIDLYREETPLTTLNFLTLVKQGFYDGIVFHRIIPDFMAQVGDPLTKDPSKQALWGTGDPGYKIADEFAPGLTHSGPGIVSMANAGPNTGGSQIFITYEATPWLDGKHAVFGKVSSGMEVVEQLTVGDKIIKATIQ